MPWKSVPWRSVGTLLGAACICALSGCGKEPVEDDEGEITLPPDKEFVLAAGPLTEADLMHARALACAQGTLTADLPSATIEFVVDVSGSMSLAPVPGSPSKWESTKAALSGSLAELSEDTVVGAIFFPNQATIRNCTTAEGDCEPGPPAPVEQCIRTESIVPLSALGNEDSKTRAKFEFALEQVNPAGATPTHDAYLLALKELAPVDAHEPPFIVLITDGQPTFLHGCSGSGQASDPVDETPIIEAIAAAQKAGISTFVIGSPGSEENAQTGGDARPWLSKAARAGGTAAESCSDEGPNYCHVDMTEEPDFGDSLEHALSRVLRHTGTCEFGAPASAERKQVDADLLNAIFLPGFGAAEVLPKQEEASCEVGWFQGETSLRLCSETCSRLRGDERARIELLFGCTPVVSPPLK